MLEMMSSKGPTKTVVDNNSWEVLGSPKLKGRSPLNSKKRMSEEELEEKMVFQARLMFAYHLSSQHLN